MSLLLGKYRTYNVLLHDQPCTIPLLASDIAHILKHLSIPTPVHSVIGVSQGGAIALAFGARFPDLTRSIVSCDTSARTPSGNKEAWASRIDLAAKGGVDESGVGASMRELGSATLSRSWRRIGTPKNKNETILEDMIMKTTLDGFKLGAGALMEYDLID
ncbi:hypothetical protein MPER_04974, partial [Moniliophthora perniciosa FA553]